MSAGALLADPETKRALALDALAAILPADRRDRLATTLSDDDVATLRSVLASLGLPLTYRGDRWDALLGAMRRDKKSRGDLLRFVVLDSLGHPTRLEGPDPTLLAAAYAEVSEDAPAGGRPVSL